MGEANIRLIRAESAPATHSAGGGLRRPARQVGPALRGGCRHRRRVLAAVTNGALRTRQALPAPRSHFAIWRRTAGLVPRQRPAPVLCRRGQPTGSNEYCGLWLTTERPLVGARRKATATPPILGGHRGRRSSQGHLVSHQASSATPQLHLLIATATCRGRRHFIWCRPEKLKTLLLAVSLNIVCDRSPRVRILR
jgi:hypothetical protein